MSLQPAEKTSTMGLVASRRNVVRGAAVWSGAAVTVAVAAPNAAAHSHTGGGPVVVAPTVTVVAGVPIKYSDNNVKYVAWDIDVTSTNMDLTGLTLHLTYHQTGGGQTAVLNSVEVRNYSPSGEWSETVTKPSMTATASASFGGTVAEDQPARIHIQFQGSDNSSGQVSATLFAHNSAGELVQIAALSPTWWDSGKKHNH